MTAIRILFNFIAFLAVGSIAYADCGCGPDFCINGNGYASKLEKKKASLAKDHPADLVALLDRDGACVARVERAPDGFSIRLVEPNGKMTTSSWTATAEAEAKDLLKSGAITKYYKFNVDRRFACCKEAEYDKQPDWNASHALNTSLAKDCRLSGGNVTCN